MPEILYRKWRPRTFGEVAGQEHVAMTLKNAAARGCHVENSVVRTDGRSRGNRACHMEMTENAADIRRCRRRFGGVGIRVACGPDDCAAQRSEQGACQR